LNKNETNEQFKQSKSLPFISIITFDVQKRPPFATTQALC